MFFRTLLQYPKMNHSLNHLLHMNLLRAFQLEILMQLWNQSQDIFWGEGGQA